IVVSPRVASDLLSYKRRKITMLEMRTDKEVLVRVSETIPVDRVTFYAYDDRGADVDVQRLPKLKPDSTPVEWKDAVSAAEALTDPLEEEKRMLREFDAAADAADEPEL